MQVAFYKHNIGQEEKAAVLAALDLEFLTTGKITTEFEKAFSKHTAIPYTVGLMSCTAALELSLRACGVGTGDEVVTTPMTFVATSLAIIHCGAIPIWVDVEPTTGNIDADKIEQAITPKTKAILPVHLYGQMCDMKKIRAIADKHKLYVIEDAAHALDSERDGIRVGELGDFACFSFYATKSITCGEGGAVAVHDKKFNDKIRLLRSHGLSSDAADRYQGAYKHWDLVDFGYKCNMDNIKAAMLIPQLAKSKQQRDAREQKYKRYKAILGGMLGIDFPEILEESKSDHHLFTIWVDPAKRDSILHRMQEAGIGVAVNYKSINLLTALKEKYGVTSFPNSELMGASTISLPFYPKLTNIEIDHICERLLEVV
jgi:dTDP-4-amino-4,6-dideoxygalactose transaminase